MLDSRHGFLKEREMCDPQPTVPATGSVKRELYLCFTLLQRSSIDSPLDLDSDIGILYRIRGRTRERIASSLLMMTLSSVRARRMINIVWIITTVWNMIIAGTGIICCFCKSGGTIDTKAALLPVISAFSSDKHFNWRNRSDRIPESSLNQQLQIFIHLWSSSGPSKYIITKCHTTKASVDWHVVTHRNCISNDEAESKSKTNRRSFLRSASAFIATSTLSSLTQIEQANAAIVDATDIFADNNWSSNSKRTNTQKGQQSLSIGKPSTEVFTPTDEIKIKFNRKKLQQMYDGRLGIELVDIEFRTNLRVRVKSVQEGSYAASQELPIQSDWILVSINGRSVERTNAAGVRQCLIEAIQQPSNDDIVVVFRDPSMFQSQLRDVSTSGTDPVNDAIPTVTTQIGPSGDTTQRKKDGTVQSGQMVTTADNDQRITVQQLQKKSSLCTHGAEIDDLLEISYTGTVVETGQIFDGSAILINNQGIPGRGNDISLFFVLGKQPLGQFPPGWDVGLVGMCAGERRRLIIPPALAYGSKGLARRNIPPNATLQYDITLISVNGIAI